MSYDIYLKDPKTGITIEFPENTNLRGGTYQLGGTTEAHFNITYNYADILYKVLGDKGIRFLYDKTGNETLVPLAKAISKLSSVQDTHDYWESTEYSVRQALINVWILASMAPEGIWSGD